MTEIVHAVPPTGSGLTPCCGRTPIELPLTDRITSEETVTCPGPLLMPGEWHDAPTADAERYKADYLRACETVAQMHAAATGRPGEGPTQGVVEDVEDVRRRAERAEAAIGRVHDELADCEDDDWMVRAGDIRDALRPTQPSAQPAPAVPTPPATADWQSVLRGFQVLLAAYPADLDPDGPAVRPRPLPAELVARWRDTVHAARAQLAADRCCGKPPGAICVHDIAPSADQTKEK